MLSIPTPNFAHLYEDNANTRVYEPAEDTFLLIDALESDIQFIRSKSPNIILEVGSGSGVVITALARVLKGSPTFFISTDKNKYASQATLKTAKCNKVSVEVITTDLVSCLDTRLAGFVDILIFNPPYVVTPDDEVGNVSSLSLSWAGGVKGRIVMDKLFPVIGQLLSSRGSFYLVVIKENDIEELKVILPGFHCEVLMSRKSGQECLSVLKYSRFS